TKYWLMAVSSDVNTSFRISMIFASPFMGERLSRERECGGSHGRRAGWAGDRSRCDRGSGSRDCEHRAKRVVAGTALGAKAAAPGIPQGGCAVVDGPGDVPVGFAAADADDHVGFVPLRRGFAFETQSQQNVMMPG